MSQLPVNVDDYQDSKASYLQGYRKIQELVDSGVSWSGHERNTAFLNTGSRKGAVAKMVDVSSAIGFDFDDDARGIAAIDWNYDGAMDFFLTNRTAPRLRFLRNNLAPSDRFLKLKLQGTTCNRDAIGARAMVTLRKDGQPVSLMRTVYAGHGFISQSSKWLHFGLDSDATVEQVQILWPDGKREVFPAIVPGGHYVLVQGSGRPDKFTPPTAAIPLVRSPNAKGESGETVSICLADRIPIPPIQFTDSDGKTRTLTPPLQRPVLINLWAPWCAPCIAELTELTDRQSDITAADLEIIALNVDVLKNSDDETIKKGKQLLSRIKFPFSSGLPDKTLIRNLELAHNSTFFRPNQLPVPCSLLVDTSGKIAAVYRGRVSADELLRDVAVLNTNDSKAWSDHSRLFAGRWITDREKVPYLHMVTTLLNEKSINAAADFLIIHRDVLEWEPMYAKTLMVCGTELIKIESMDKGKKMLQEALALDSSLAEAHNNLGLVLRGEGKRTAAKEHLFKALRLNPDYVDAMLNLALCDMDSSHFERALDRVNAAMKIQKENPTALLMAGNLNIQLGQWLAAKESLEKLLIQQPDRVDVLVNLGGVHAKLGEYDKSIRFYEQALKIKPKMPSVEQALEAARRLEQGIESAP